MRKTKTGNAQPKPTPQPEHYVSDGEYLDRMLLDIQTGKAPPGAEFYTDAILRVRKQLS